MAWRTLWAAAARLFEPPDLALYWAFDRRGADLGAGDRPLDEKQARIAAECFRKANDAFNRKNFDYAADMYAKCAMLSPANLTYRVALRGSQQKKHGDNGTGAGSLSKMKIGGLRKAAKKARAKEDFTAASVELEKALDLNPWDVPTNHELSQLAMQAEWEEVGEFAMKMAWQGDKKNEELSVAFADVLAERRKFQDAAKVYEHLAAMFPGNGEYRAQISRMLTKHTTESAKFEEANRSTDLAADGSMASHEVEKRIGKEEGLSVEQELARATRKEPDNYEAWQKYAAHLLKVKSYDEALKAADTALELQPGDQAATEMKEDAELGILAAQLADAKAAAAGPKDEALREAGKALLKREIEVMTNRVKRYPQDMRHKYELAQRLMRIKKYPAAIPLLQKATQSPKYEARAFSALGKCFLKENKAGLARGQFERALTKLHPENERDEVLEAHYLLGRIYEQLKKPEEAESHYGEVLVLEYDYEDAKDRLEALQAAEA